MRRSLDQQLKTPRPRRGSPEQTRERLVAAAAKLFNRVGYHGTDSNRIAREANYSTGTFYKHFKDKREIFLAAYETWVASEWKAVASELAAGGTAEEIAGRLVALSFTTERTFDAIAQGELRDLGLDQKVVLEAIVEKLASALA
jgi:AcrR family transcriptional regulator